MSEILKKAPNEHELFYLLTDISDLWYEIGICLYLSANELTAIKQKLISNNVKLLNVITLWKHTQPVPFTWETVISCIEGPIVLNKRKANEIRQYLSEGKNYLILNMQANDTVIVFSIPLIVYIMVG